MNNVVVVFFIINLLGYNNDFLLHRCYFIGVSFHLHIGVSLSQSLTLLDGQSVSQSTHTHYGMFNFISA